MADLALDRHTEDDFADQNNPRMNVIVDATTTLLILLFTSSGDIRACNVTYGSQQMSYYNGIVGTGSIGLFYLTNPTVGTAEILGASNLQSEFAMCAIGFSNADLQKPIGNLTTDTGTAVQSSIVVTSVSAKNFVVDMSNHHFDALTVGAGQTEMLNANSNNFFAGASYEQGIGARTMSWTWAGARGFVALGAEIRDASLTAKGGGALLNFI